MNTLAADFERLNSRRRNERASLTVKSINEFVGIAHQSAVDGGWWTSRRGRKKRPDVPRLLCLIHSEISEALEGHRKDLQDSHLPHRKMIEVEIADAFIRLGDLAGALALDVGGAIVEKLAYNKVRQDHKRSVRRAKNGKKF